MGNNNPLPVSLPAECRKAAKLFSAFVDPSKGLDSVIPSHILRKAKGFAFLTVVKAGFIMSVRAGTGVAIARLPDGSWSAPSAIGTAGVGGGFQAGVEMAEFFIVLNSRAAVASFMAAGSLSLGGNMSIAAGPIGRNVEGTGTLSSKGRMSAMYSYSRTKGLFGGASIEGSVIVERSDANSKAYGSNVTAKQLLSGAIDPPGFAEILIDTISRRSGTKNDWDGAEDEDMDGGMRPDDLSRGYSFGSSYASGGSNGFDAPSKSRFGRSRSGSGADQTSSGPIASETTRFENQFSDEFNNFDKDEDWRAATGGDPTPGKKSSPTKLTKSRSGSLGTFGNNNGNQWESASAPTRDSFDSLDAEDDRRAATAHFQQFGPSEDEDDRDDGRDFGGRNDSSNKNRFRSSTISVAPSRPSVFARARSASSPFSSKSKKQATLSFRDGPSSPFADKYDDPDDRTDSYDRPSSRTTTTRATSSAKPWDEEDTTWATDTPRRGTTPVVSPKLVSAPGGRDPFDFSEVSVEFDRARSGSGSGIGVRKAPPPVVPARRATVGGIGRAIALYDFDGAEPTDLPFRKGDVITILAKDDEEWWKGRNKTVEGMFPRNYVEAHFD